MAEASDTSSAEITHEQQGGPIQVKELGLTQIDGHPEDHPFIADVIFIHGLQGHPKHTWQSKSSAESSTRPRKRLRPFSWKDTEVIAHDDQKPFWPADILPRDHKDVRILTLGYDSKVTKGFMAPTSKNGIFQHGNSFLRAVGRARIGCRQRPIVFVAHSLGGLVVKQALIEARKQTYEPDLRDIYSSTHAIIFFGTPHRGSDLASWSLLLSDIAEAAQLDTNNAILRDLDPTSGSSKLEEMRLDFDDILRDSHRSKDLQVYSFQEEEGMTGIKMFGNKVVPNESSSLDSRKYGNDTIHANHMNMCRFEANDDDGYEKFSGILAKYIGQIKSERDEGEKARRDDILSRLDFAERCSREYQLQNGETNEESFLWIWSPSTSFADWLSSREGVYWITGKPGSGKSTLVNYLVNQNLTISKLQQHGHMDWNVLRFFFDFRGGKGINNSFEGLLRSLLLQLINAIPQPKQLSSDEKKNYPQSDWPEHKLRDALRRLLNNAKQGVCIFVDGLDEYEGNVLQLIQFLRSLATSKDSKSLLTKICVSSRPEPIPAQLLQHLPNLSISDHNEPGIESYSRLTLEGLGYEVLEDLDVPRLSLIVAQRAEGVFLWARFALEELIQGYCNGDKFQELLARLESIPHDLEEIYNRMLSRMEPTSKRECMIMLQLVCFAERSLSWQELLVATETAMNKDVVLSERICSDEDSADAPALYKSFARRLRAKAAGLLELVDEEAKLIHKSVSAYLNQRGWQTLGGSEGENMVEHQSMYVQTCTRYLHRLLRHCKLEKVTGEYFFEKAWSDGNTPNGLDGSMELNRELSHPLGTYHFFTYAAGYIIEHAKSLERHGTSSYPLLHGCLTEQLVCLHFICVVEGANRWCGPCEEAHWRLLVEDFDAIYVAFLHGLVSYCKEELATRSPAPGQPFWARALRLALFSTTSWDVRYTFGSQEVVSLALQNITTVQQSHLEQAFFHSLYPILYEAVDLMLQHESVKTLRLVDSNGQAVTLLWMFTRFYEGHRWGEWSECNTSERFLSLLIETASNRGEDVRQRCGPEGNVVETLLKQSPTYKRSDKLLLLREHYESMSWPFPYDVGEIEREG